MGFLSPGPGHGGRFPPHFGTNTDAQLCMCLGRTALLVVGKMVLTDLCFPRPAPIRVLTRKPKNPGEKKEEGPLPPPRLGLASSGCTLC